MTNSALVAIAAASALGQIPHGRHLAAQAVEYEQAMRELSAAFNLPLDEAREQFEARRVKSVMSWRDLVCWCLHNGEL